VEIRGGWKEERGLGTGGQPDITNSGRLVTRH